MANVIFTSHKKEVEDAMDKVLATALETVGQVAEGNAIKEITSMVYDTAESPTYVRTGRLRNSITHATKESEGKSFSYSDSKGKQYSDKVGGGIGEYEVWIGTNVEYAPYVHEGTSRMPPRRFLRAAVEKYVDQYKKLFDEAMKNLR